MDKAKSDKPHSLMEEFLKVRFTTTDELIENYCQRKIITRTCLQNGDEDPRIKEAKRDLIYLMKKQGLPFTEIGSYLNLSAQEAVGTYLEILREKEAFQPRREEEIKIRVRRSDSPLKTDNDPESIIRWIKLGLSAEEVSKKTGVPSKEIKSLCLNNEVYLPRQRSSKSKRGVLQHGPSKKIIRYNKPEGIIGRSNLLRNTKRKNQTGIELIAATYQGLESAYQGLLHANIFFPELIAAISETELKEIERKVETIDDSQKLKFYKKKGEDVMILKEGLKAFDIESSNLQTGETETTEEKNKNSPKRRNHKTSQRKKNPEAETFLQVWLNSLEPPMEVEIEKEIFREIERLKNEINGGIGLNTDTFLAASYMILNENSGYHGFSYGPIKFDRITIQEELKRRLPLERRIEQLKQKVVKANGRWATTLAMKAGKKRGLMDSYGEDLIQMGNLGLLRAIEDYDPDKGNTFATYSAWWIKAHIARAISSETKTVRIPIHAAEDLTKYKRIIAQAKDETELKKLLEEAGFNEKKTGLLERINQKTLSLDQPPEGSETSLMDIVPCEEPEYGETERRDMIQRLNAILAEIKQIKNLSDRDWEILKTRMGMVTGESLTLESIAQIMGLSKERIRQIEKRTLTKMRRSPYRSELENLL